MRIPSASLGRKALGQEPTATQRVVLMERSRLGQCLVPTESIRSRLQASIWTQRYRTDRRSRNRTPPRLPGMEGGTVAIGSKKEKDPNRTKAVGCFKRVGARRGQAFREAADSGSYWSNRECCRSKSIYPSSRANLTRRGLRRLTRGCSFI
jgi:hypothetical protein